MNGRSVGCQDGGADRGRGHFDHSSFVGGMGIEWHEGGADMQRVRSTMLAPIWDMFS